MSIEDAYTWSRPICDLHMLFLWIPSFPPEVVDFPDLTLRMSLGTFSMILLNFQGQGHRQILQCYFVTKWNTPEDCKSNQKVYPVSQSVRYFDQTLQVHNIAKKELFYSS